MEFEVPAWDAPGVPSKLDYPAAVTSTVDVGGHSKGARKKRLREEALLEKLVNSKVILRRESGSNAAENTSQAAKSAPALKPQQAAWGDTQPQLTKAQKRRAKWEAKQRRLAAEREANPDDAEDGGFIMASGDSAGAANAAELGTRQPKKLKLADAEELPAQKRAKKTKSGSSDDGKSALTGLVPAIEGSPDDGEGAKQPKPSRKAARKAGAPKQDSAAGLAAQQQGASAAPGNAAEGVQGSGDVPKKKKRNRNKFKQDAAEDAAGGAVPHVASSPQPLAVAASNGGENAAVLRIADEGAAGPAEEGGRPNKKQRRKKQKEGLASSPAGADATGSGLNQEPGKGLPLPGQVDGRTGGADAAVAADPAAGSAVVQANTARKKPKQTPGAAPAAAAKAPMAAAANPTSEPNPKAAVGTGRGASGLLEKMRARLSGGHFRWLNERLYTSPGDEAFQLMQEEPHLFTAYHEGFREQTQHWPVQPIEVAKKFLQRFSKRLCVADFGCGDAVLAASLPQHDIKSLDLVAAVPGVIACNMADTPLESGSVDVAVLCLALMGTDYPSFLAEAARVLRPGGRLWIAEVRSRFADHEGPEGAAFVAALTELGFKLQRQDASNKMFIVFELAKRNGGPGGKSTDAHEIDWPDLKPCVYKRR